MKSFNMHTNSSKHSKRNNRRRPNTMKDTVPRDKDTIPPHIFNAYKRKQNYENVEPLSKNSMQIVFSNIRPKTYYAKDFRPIYFTTEQTKLPEVTLCTEVMSLFPKNNKKVYQNVNKKIVRYNSTLLARLTMNALAASETDINSILELIETMYNTIQVMLQDVKPKQSIVQERMQDTKYVINVNLKKFIKYLNEQYSRNTLVVPQNGNNVDIVPRWKQPSRSYPDNKCRSFNILLQHSRISFHISVCKFNSCSMDFFQRIATFYNSCNMTYNTTKRKPVPSVFIHDWHFRNVSQGYLLSVLLKHNNVISLNVMRKLYFVIITSVTPNLTIEINFKLANGIFLTQDTPPFEKCPFHWNDRHRNILQRSSRILNTQAFTYNIPSQSDDLNNVIGQDTKSDNTLHGTSSKTSSTLKYESSEYEGSDYFVGSTSYSQSGFLDVKSTESSTNLTLIESERTLTLSIDEPMLSYHALLNNRKDCGDMNFTSMPHERPMIYSTQQSRTWFSKAYNESAKLNAYFVANCLNYSLNETIFDRLTLPIEECVGAFTQYWTQFNHRTFCKRFLADLGIYLIRTLSSGLLLNTE